MTGNDATWHLDKRVPISLILAIVLQTGAFVWVAAQMQIQIQTNAQNIQLNKDFSATERNRVWDRVQENEKASNKISNDMAGVKASVDHLIRQSERILNKLEEKK